MKKTMTSILSAVLVLTMLLGFTGCNNGGVVGKWQCDIDGSSVVSRFVPNGLSFPEFKLRVFFEFKENGEAILSVDEAHLKAQVPALIDSIAAQVAAMSNMSVEAYYDEINSSREQEIAQVETELAQGVKAASIVGKYVVEGDQMWLSKNGGKDDDPLTFKLEGDTMYLAPTDLSDTDEVFKALLPLTLTRVG